MNVYIEMDFSYRGFIQTSRFRSLYVYEKNYIKKFTTNTQLLTKKEKLFILYQPGSTYKSLS